MHLAEQYSLAMGARIDKPFIETNYYPLPFSKYIVVENGADIKSRIYGIWPDVVLEIKPYLDKHNIEIVQIGHKDSEPIPAAFDLRGRTTTTGPGRPAVDRAAACAVTAAIWLLLLGWRTALAMGENIAAWSIS